MSNETVVRNVRGTRVYSLMRTAEWVFFLNVAVLLLPNDLVKGAAATVTAPLILVAGLILLSNWRGAISEFSGELESRDYALARVVSSWPNYFWRSAGAGVAIVGATVFAIGIAHLTG